MRDAFKRRILLVDDDLAVALSLRAILEMYGFETDTAGSVPEARARLNGSRYHMVITDMRMEEDLSGLQVIQAAKETGYDPAIAVLTAYPELGSETAEKGADSMLVKPVEMETLLCQIEALLVQHEDRKRNQGPSQPLLDAPASNEKAVPD